MVQLINELFKSLASRALLFSRLNCMVLSGTYPGAQRNATADVSELSTAARFMRRPRAIKIMLIAILIPHAVRVDQPCDMV